MRVALVAVAVLTTVGCASPTCPAWDARGDGGCNLILGCAWNGRECVVVSGCACASVDCDRLRGDDDGDACMATACEPRGDAGR